MSQRMFNFMVVLVHVTQEPAKWCLW